MIKKQNDSGQDIRKRLIQLRNVVEISLAPLIQENDQESW